MNARVQIVGRIPGELSRRVRAAAKRRTVSLNTFLIDALAAAVAGSRRSPAHAARRAEGDEVAP